MPVVAAAALAAGALACAGCVSPNPLASWQQRVEEYITQVGHGDANVLRQADRPAADVVDRPALLTFGELRPVGPGLPPLGETREALGLLLGYREVDGRGWYVFMLAIVGVAPRPGDGRAPAETIRDLRPVALCPAAPRHVWAVGPADAAALRTYLATRAAQGADELSDRFFPGFRDDWRLDVQDAAFHAVDRNSGARWTLPIPPPEDGT